LYKHLLVPLDGSPTSEAALTHAIALARTCGAVLTVMTVYDPFPMIAAAAEYGSYQVQLAEDLRLEAELTVNAARTRAEAADLTVTARVVDLKTVWRAILDVAQSDQADLIVMGSHGRSGLDKLVMGSETQRVLQHTHLPVLVVRD
jgi:nucleotide-binding universal stress UspA family protein